MIKQAKRCLLYKNEFTALEGGYRENSRLRIGYARTLRTKSILFRNGFYLVFF